MILEIAIVVAAGASAGAALIVSVARWRAEATRTTPKSPELGRLLERAPTEPRGLKSGDVLLVLGEELALGGTLALDDGGFVLRMLPTIGRASARWVVQLDPEAQRLALVSESTEIGEGRVPDSLPIGGRTLVLERRGVARVRAQGDDVPKIDGARAPYVILGERGGRTAIVLEPEGHPRLALLGEQVDRRTVELLPGGDVERTP